MSASSKKKLRKEQAAAELTEKQRKQQSEDRKLKAYSVTFIAIVAVIVVAALAIAGVTAVNRYGLVEKATVAATVDGEKLNSVEMNYYYVDAVNSTYKQWSSAYGDNASLYAMMMGLDLATPLDEQFYDEETGTTWADYFYDVALEQAKSDIVLAKMAEKDGFALSEDKVAELELTMTQFHSYLPLYGYSNVDDFYRASYGNGANQDSYWEYSLRSSLAAAYYNNFADSLTYDDADLRAYESEVGYKHYNSYDYASYYVSYTSYQEGGTEDENGSVTYSDAEKDAARAKAKEVAEELATSDSVEALDAAIAALPVNADVENAASTKYEGNLYSNVNSTIIDWLSNDARKAGDITAIENVNTSTDDDGNSVDSVSGYYVVMFQGCTENLRPLANVRHILVSFESDDGTTDYTDEDKAEALEEAEAILAQWKAGEATEESFIELVKEKSDDTGSVENGGLFENITPEQGVYVESFTNWAVDESRAAGDTGIIESEYGYHIMYYVGDSAETYRDYMIRSELKQEDVAAWYDEIIGAVSASKGNTSKLSTNMVMQAAS